MKLELTRGVGKIPTAFVVETKKENTDAEDSKNENIHVPEPIPDEPADENAQRIIDNSYFISQNRKKRTKTKKKEKSTMLGVTVFEKDIKRLDYIMEFIGTNNRSEAAKFWLEAGWACVGKEIKRQVDKRRRVQGPKTKVKLSHIPTYHKTNFRKNLERINLKVISDVIDQIIEEDRKDGIEDDIRIIDLEYLEKYHPKWSGKPIKPCYYSKKVDAELTAIREAEEKFHVTDMLFTPEPKKEKLHNKTLMETYGKDN